MSAAVDNIEKELKDEIISLLKNSGIGEQTFKYKLFDLENIIIKYSEEKHKKNFEEFIKTYLKAEKEIGKNFKDDDKRVIQDYKKRAANYTGMLVEKLKKYDIEFKNAFLKLNGNHATIMFFIEPEVLDDEYKETRAYLTKSVISDYVNFNDPYISIHILLIDEEFEKYNFITMYNDGFKFKYEK